MKSIARSYPVSMQDVLIPAGAVLLVLCVAFAAPHAYGQDTQTNEGSATVLLEYQVPAEIADNDALVERHVNQMAAIIKSNDVLTGAVMKLKGNAYVVETIRAGKDPVEAISNIVSADVVPKTFLIEVIASARSDAASAEIANTLANEAVERTDIWRQERLLSQIRELTREQEAALRLVDDYRERLNRLPIFGPGGAVTTPMSVAKPKFEHLMQALTKVEADYIEAKKKQAELNGLSEDQGLLLPEVQDAVDNDPQMKVLYAKKVEAEIAMEEAKITAGNDSPAVKQAAATLTAVQEVLKKRQAALAPREFKNLKEQRQRRVAELQQIYINTKSSLNEVSQEIKAYDESQTQVEDAKRDVAKAEKQLEALDSELLQLRLKMQTGRPLVIRQKAKP